MRILALIMTATAVSVWWHPLPLVAQFSALIGLAAGCMAIRGADKRAARVLGQARDIIAQAHADLHGNSARQADVIARLEELGRLVNRGRPAS